MALLLTFGLTGLVTTAVAMHENATDKTAQQVMRKASENKAPESLDLYIKIGDGDEKTVKTVYHMTTESTGLYSVENVVLEANQYIQFRDPSDNFSYTGWSGYIASTSYPFDLSEHSVNANSEHTLKLGIDNGIYKVSYKFNGINGRSELTFVKQNNGEQGGEQASNGAPEKLDLYIISSNGEKAVYHMTTNALGSYSVKDVKIDNPTEQTAQLRDPSNNKNYTGTAPEVRSYTNEIGLISNGHAECWLGAGNVSVENNNASALKNLKAGKYQISFTYKGDGQNSIFAFVKQKDIIIDPVLNIISGPNKVGGLSEVMYYNFHYTRHESVITVPAGDRLKFTDGSGKLYCAKANTEIVLEDNAEVVIPMEATDAQTKSITFGEAGTYTVHMVYTDSDVSLHVKKMSYPKDLYLCFGDMHQAPKGAPFPNWVKLTPTKVAGEYITTANSEYSEGGDVLNYYDPATGNVSLKDGDLFYITSDISKVYEDRYAGQVFYGSTYANRGLTEFRPGKKVQAMTPETQPEEGGKKAKIYNWMAAGIGENNSWPMTLNIRDEIASYITWGKDFEGEDYYLYDALMKTSENREDYRFTFHPNTGLYTLYVEELYGSFKITNDGSDGTGKGCYTAYSGNESIHNPGTPYPMYSFYNLHGGTQTQNTGDVNWNGCWLDAPGFASRAWTGASDNNTQQYYVYENVQIVFDPASARLWVNALPKDDSGMEKDIVTPDPNNGELPIYIVFVERTGADDVEDLAVKEVRPMYLNIYRDTETGRTLDRGIYTSSKDGSTFDIFPASNTRTMLNKEGTEPVVYTPTYFFFTENPNITKTQLSDIYKETIYYGCRSKKKRFEITSVSKFTSKGISDVRWATSIGKRPHAENKDIDLTYSDTAHMRRYTPDVVSPVSRSRVNGKARANAVINPIYPIMAGSEAGKYIVHFNRIDRTITLFQELENNLYLVFDNARIDYPDHNSEIGTGLYDEDGGRLGEDDVIKMEESASMPGTFVAYNVPFNPTRHSDKSHFFFSGQNADKAYENYVDDFRRIYNTTNHYASILTHSRNFGARVGDLQGDQEIVFDNDNIEGFSRSHSADETEQYMFIDEQPKRARAANALDTEITNSEKAGFDFYYAKPAIYNVYFTQPGYTDPNGEVVPDNEDGRVTLQLMGELGGEFSGINDAGDNSVSVKTGKGFLEVFGASKVEVFDMAGVSVASADGNLQVELPRGVYVVTADGRNIKAIVH